MLSLLAPLVLLSFASRSTAATLSVSSDWLNSTSTKHAVCTAELTEFLTTTIATTIPETYYVNVTLPQYVNVTIKTTEVCTVEVTELVTTTIEDTVSITRTDLDTITETKTTTVPATVTTYTTTTVISTSVDPCPTTCSLSAGTVDLFFWPPSRPFTYPSTYVDTSLGYTFVSPSVYMLIPTIKGTNSLGDVGPSTSSWILPLDLEEVSTIVDGTITKQLTLEDLGTDCPRSADPTAIATMVDKACDPILAAPPQVSSWASPCNACGRFGLFDPPYAVPTVTGGLIPTTKTKTTVEETATSTPAPTSEDPTGVVVIVTYQNGEEIGKSTMTSDGMSGTTTNSVILSSTAESTSTSATSASSESTSATSSAQATTSAPSSSSVGAPSTVPPTTTPGSDAPRMSIGASWVFVGLCVLSRFM